MSRPAYLYTIGLAVQGLVFLALHLKDPKIVDSTMVAMTLPAVVLMFLLERWYKRTVVNKFQK